MSYHSKQKLTGKDIKELKRQCKDGIVLSILTAPAAFVLLAFIWPFFISDPSIIEYSLMAVVAISCGLLVAYVMTNKFLKDIRNDEKELHTKVIDKMENHIDFDAGGGKSSCLLKEKEAFTSFYFVIKNTRYKVKKQLYEQCQEGDEVFFVIAPISRYQFEIILKS
ncbi:hypothetical protein [Carboxylicivirga sp. N1Y90]|uniref:hypothetical protein n=1 Tax=Carboxylicivirga fragile TaxID=3417571 RepID=UPI003D332FC5|nr:hypothetical protein [Marinilabiliaceae bacterium N1Y90]